jgi:hypothetical protein
MAGGHSIGTSEGSCLQQFAAPDLGERDFSGSLEGGYI